MSSIPYAGIGSRETPAEILLLMRSIAHQLATRGYILRSGGAIGADQAFEDGCDDAGGKKEIFKPCSGAPHRAASAIAQSIHPNWEACSPYARACHTRNVYQVLGADLRSPSRFVICWTPNGESVGGTRTAIELAIQHQIRICNLALASDRSSICQKMKL